MSNVLQRLPKVRKRQKDRACAKSGSLSPQLVAALAHCATRLRSTDARLWTVLGWARLRLLSKYRKRRSHWAGVEMHQATACATILQHALAAFRRASLLDGRRWSSLEGQRQVLSELSELSASGVAEAESIEGDLVVWEAEAEVLRQMAKLRPRHPRTFFRLAEVLKRQISEQCAGAGDEEEIRHEAIEALKVHLDNVGALAKRKPALGERQLRLALARHMLAILRDETPDSMDTEYVSSLFDCYAPGFDKHLVEALGYKVPDLMMDELCLAWEDLGLDPKKTLKRVADLGAGTGLLGQRLRSLVSSARLEAVDISAGMLEQASRKGCYDYILEGDLCDLFLQDSFAGQEDLQLFDLVAAADVFIYVGCLKRIFGLVRKWLQPNSGLFCFSVEAPSRVAPEADKAFSLEFSGRISHSDGYVLSLANEFGFKVHRQSPCVLRTNEGSPVYGFIFTLRIVQ